MKKNPLIPLAIDFAALILICSFYTYNVALLFLLLALLATSLWLWRDTFYWRLAGIALLIGGFGEWACCRVQLWIYANPTWEGLPLWLPLIWPILAITFWRVAMAVDGWFAALPRSSFILQLLGWTTVVSYAVYSLVTIDRTIAMVYALFASAIVIWGRSRRFLLFFSIAAFGGSFGEIVCMQYDVWYYTNPFFITLGIPLSLPLAWGLSSVVIALLAGARRQIRREGEAVELPVV